MNRELLQRLQKRIAKSSVGPSTARGMGPKGTIAAAHAFLEKYDLKNIQAKSEKAFERKLEQATLNLMESLPKSGQHWGSSRKFFNIFLRNCLYNTYLSNFYGLNQLEPWLEVPLDSHVAKGLLLAKPTDLPRWKTVIGLNPELSSQFQKAALDVAHEMRTSRVHLDLLYWRGEHMANNSLKADKSLPRGALRP